MAKYVDCTSRRGSVKQKPRVENRNETCVADSAGGQPADPSSEVVGNMKSSMPLDHFEFNAESFNSMVNSFAQALSVSSKGVVPGISNEPLFCEMGKFLFSSMMTFNQILQKNTSKTSNKLKSPQNNAVLGDKSDLVSGGCVSSLQGGKALSAGKNRINGAKNMSRNLNSAHKRKVYDTGRVGDTLEDKPPASPDDNFVEIPRKEEYGSAPDHSESICCKKTDKMVHELTNGTKNNDKQRISNAKVGISKNGKKTKKVPRNESIISSDGIPVDKSKKKLHISNENTTCARMDSKNLQAPNVLEDSEMLYLGSSADPDQKLNLDIYKFVYDCSRANSSAAEKRTSVNSTETGAGTKSIKLKAHSGDDPDFSLEDSFVKEGSVDDDCAFLKAAFSGDLDTMKPFKKINVNYVDDVGRTSIHYASAAGSVLCVKYLIEKGADVNRADKKGWTALHIAVSKNFGDVAEVLIDSGTDIFAVLKHRCAPSRLVDVYSPCIHFAAIKGNIGLTKRLVEKGASYNDLDSAEMTPLHYAAFRPNLQYLEFLLDNGANVYMKDVNGRTPFHSAALSGLVENVKLMLRRSKFINEPDIWSLTPLDLARLKRRKDFVRYLKEELSVSESAVDDMAMVLSSTIAVALREPNVDQIYRCVCRIGPDICKTIFDLTMQVERNGGILTADGKRKRTSGGIFFTFLKELYLNNIISKEDYNYTRAAENEKRCAKAMERRNELKSNLYKAPRAKL